MKGTQNVKKQMTFPAKLVELTERKANKIGFTFHDYVRMLLAVDVSSNTQSVEMVDEETEYEIGLAVDSYNKGKYMLIQDKKDLRKKLGYERKKKQRAAN